VIELNQAGEFTLTQAWKHKKPGEDNRRKGSREEGSDDYCSEFDSESNLE